MFPERDRARVDPVHYPAIDDLDPGFPELATDVDPGWDLYPGTEDPGSGPAPDRSHPAYESMESDWGANVQYP